MSAESLLQEFIDGAILRGRCVWCSHPEDPPDGKHQASCLVLRATGLLGRRSEPLSLDALLAGVRL